LPGATFSGRQKPAKGVRGVFFCYALPALDNTLDPPEFTEAAGSCRWYLFDLDKDRILEEPAEIISTIRAKTETPRCSTMSDSTLVDIRKKVQRHIKDSYLRRVNAPVGVNAVLKCWMEVNGE